MLTATSTSVLWAWSGGARKRSLVLHLSVLSPHLVSVDRGLRCKEECISLQGVPSTLPGLPGICFRQIWFRREGVLSKTFRRVRHTAATKTIYFFLFENRCGPRNPKPPISPIDNRTQGLNRQFVTHGNFCSEREREREERRGEREGGGERERGGRRDKKSQSKHLG